MQTSCETEPSLTQFNGWFSRDSVCDTQQSDGGRERRRRFRLRCRAEDSRSQQNDQRPDHSL